MKESEEMRLKCVVNESTRAPLTRSLFPNGEGNETRMPLFSHCQNKYTHMWKKNNDGQSLPREGKALLRDSSIYKIWKTCKPLNL